MDFVATGLCSFTPSTAKYNYNVTVVPTQKPVDDIVTLA